MKPKFVLVGKKVTNTEKEAKTNPVSSHWNHNVSAFMTFKTQ
jgi:hypothetical protein